MKQWGRIDQSLTLMGIMLGCGTAFLIWGRFPDAEARLWQQSVHFSRLPPAEQESVLESYYSHFQKCTPERQQTLQKIVSAVQQDDVLRDKLQTLDEWFLSLPRQEQSLWRERLAAGDVLAVSGKIHEYQQVSRQLLVDFSPGRFSRQRSAPPPRRDTEPPKDGLPVLALRYDQYTAILDEAFPDQDLSPREIAAIAQLESSEEQTLCKTLLLLQRMRENRFAGDYADALIAALRHQTESFDSEWQRRFTEFVGRIDRVESGSFRRIARTMTVVAVLDEAVAELGANFKDRMPTPQEDLIRAFAELDDARKRTRLMVGTPEAARDELRKIVIQQQQVDDPVRRQLMLKLIDYEENLAAFRDTIFGRFGGFGGRSSGGPPPSFERRD